MESLWKSESSLPEFPELDKDMTTDVLIIGGGIAGVLTAYFLQQNNIRYILVEKNRICSGTTQNTTAKITCQQGLIYSRILKSYGSETALKYLSANQSAFEMYARLCKNINCDYEIKDNYVYSTENRKKLEDEMSALDKIGCQAEFCENIPVPMPTVGAVKFPNQAQFSPLKFITGISRNLNIYENTFVKEITDGKAITNQGTIEAEKFIVTTHFPFINKHGSYFLKLYQHRSYVIAFENSACLNGMYVDENHKGMSFRNYKNMLLIGGGGHRTGKKGGGWEEIQNFAKQNFPESKEKYSWAAQDCMSLDGIPYIGRYSKNTPDLYVAGGFNKWGITGSMVSAMILSDMVLGRQNEFADIFNPSRSILKPQLFANTFETIINFLTPTAPRCSHMGCALKWNPTEHSWDCPCHGSRFSGQGEILDNPANKNL